MIFSKEDKERYVASREAQRKIAQAEQQAYIGASNKIRSALINSYSVFVKAASEIPNLCCEVGISAYRMCSPTFFKTTKGFCLPLTLDGAYSWISFDDSIPKKFGNKSSLYVNKKGHLVLRENYGLDGSKCIYPSKTNRMIIKYLDKDWIPFNGDDTRGYYFYFNRDTGKVELYSASHVSLSDLLLEMSYEISRNGYDGGSRKYFFDPNKERSETEKLDYLKKYFISILEYIETHTGYIDRSGRYHEK